MDENISGKEAGMWQEERESKDRWRNEGRRKEESVNQNVREIKISQDGCPQGCSLMRDYRNEGT